MPTCWCGCSCLLLQDHALPDLIWNQQTRGELRASLDAELREVRHRLLLLWLWLWLWVLVRGR